MTSTVTTPSRPLAAGCRPRRSAVPIVLSLKDPRPRRRTTSTSCAALASPEKQSTATRGGATSRAAWAVARGVGRNSSGAAPLRQARFLLEASSASPAPAPRTPCVPRHQASAARPAPSAPHPPCPRPRRPGAPHPGTPRLPCPHGRTPAPARPRLPLPGCPLRRPAPHPRGRACPPGARHRPASVARPPLPPARQAPRPAARHRLLLVLSSVQNSRSHFRMNKRPRRTLTPIERTLVCRASFGPGRGQFLAPPLTATTNKLPRQKQPAEEEEEQRTTHYNEVAAALESIYKLSPAAEDTETDTKKKKKKKKKVQGKGSTVIVRSRRRRRMDLGKRVERMMTGASSNKSKHTDDDEEEMLLREHAVSTDMGSLDWKRMKIPPVLSSAHTARLFKIMQPMKAIFEVQESLRQELQREPTDSELAEANDMTVQQLRRRLDVGRAARNKLIKHNLRLVLYAINKYYPDMASDERFDELCQAGAAGLITAVDRFEPKRGFRISTYALFWIRHSVVRAITLSSFTRFPFAMEAQRQEVAKAREDLAFELGRPPTDDEIVARVGISPERYRDVLRMTRPTYSLHSRNRVTQEELINEVTEEEAIGADANKNNTLLRLAIDDLLDSLKPKESLVIRQRFGLDGRGKRTFSEIAGNLNISREMVRKYELKALMKLKHPTRVEYLRRYM